MKNFQFYSISSLIVPSIRIYILFSFPFSECVNYGSRVYKLSRCFLFSTCQGMFVPYFHSFFVFHSIKIIFIAQPPNWTSSYHNLCSLHCISITIWLSWIALYSGVQIINANYFCIQISKISCNLSLRAIFEFCYLILIYSIIYHEDYAVVLISIYFNFHCHFLNIFPVKKNVCCSLTLDQFSICILWGLIYENK